MSVVTVACVQLDSSATEAVEDRIERGLELLADAASDADLVVLPELWTVGAFDVEAARDRAEPIDGPLVTALRDVARSTGTWIHGGTFSELGLDGERHNTAVVVDPEGNLSATYPKIHLFGFEGGETTVMSAGDRLVVAETAIGDTGLATCYDLRFPELFRDLVDLGATSFVISSGWPSPRIAHWSLLTRARAVENQAYVIACNGVGTHAGVTLGGRSVIVDPTGQVLAEAGAGEEVIAASVDLDLVAKWRSDFPVLLDRRL